MRECPYCEATDEADRERSKKLAAAIAAIEGVREMLDDADGVAFGRMGSHLDEMAVNFDKAIASLKAVNAR